MTELQETFVIAELIKTQAQLRDSMERLNAILSDIKSAGIPQSVPVTFDKEQVAEFLHVKPETIDNWVSKGHIPYRKASGRVFFILDELNEWTKPVSRK